MVASENQNVLVTCLAYYKVYVVEFDEVVWLRTLDALAKWTRFLLPSDCREAVKISLNKGLEVFSQ